MNIYDAALARDGMILHSLGLMLQREENVATPKPLPPGVGCAWCDSEAGVALKPGEPLRSHGICPRHHAGIKAHLEELRRIAA